MGKQLDLFAAVREAERLASEARQAERDKETRAGRLRAAQQLQVSEARAPTAGDAQQLQEHDAPALAAAQQPTSTAHEAGALDPPRPQDADAAPLHVHVPASLSPARRGEWIALCREEADQRDGASAEPRGG